MANTVALVLRTHEKKITDQTLYTVYVRISIDRKRNYMSTGVRILKSQWDEKSHQVVNVPGAAQRNVGIEIVMSQVLQDINKRKLEGKQLTAQTVKTSFVAKDLQNIFSFVEKYSRDVKGKRVGATIENYEKHMRKLEEFHGSRNLNFEEIDVDYLNRYETFLRHEGKNIKSEGGEDGLGNNYVHLLFRTLRTFFNAAIKQGLITDYPFDRYEFPTYQAPIKDYLTLKDLQLWEKYADTVKNKALKETAVYFLLGCYTGLRISDWRQFNLKEHIKSGRLLLRATKNKEWVSMEISKPLQRTLQRVAKVPLTIEEPTINEKLKLIATALELNKKVTSHTGRHTFAITLCAELGIPSETCANLMGITIATCVENYYRVTRSKIDRETKTAWMNLK